MKSPGTKDTGDTEGHDTKIKSLGTSGKERGEETKEGTAQRKKKETNQTKLML